jgi:eukaryotic-like serine/threonine-protein kinase
VNAARLMIDQVGRSFSDRYTLEARIAGGGMGDVYKGHDLLLDRPVAVKVLQPSLASDPDFVARFRAEARAAARLTHPNVVGVYDWGSADELTYYMVMEYVPGNDLRDVLATRGALQPAQAVVVMAAVCDALDEAHSGGLVHRDVKPENILIDRMGKVKVADFGIALAMDADRTMPGGVISGTLRYLSPEQADGEQATPASDIWAAGAILTELVTGSPPFTGSPADLLRRRATEDPIVPSDIDPGLGEWLDQIVLQACAVDPGERFATAGEMADALRAVVPVWPDPLPLRMLVQPSEEDLHLPDSESTSIVDLRERPRPVPRRWGWKVAAAAALLFLLVAAGYQLWASANQPHRVSVPHLDGAAASKAIDRARAAGLRAFIGGRVPDFTVPRGRVVAQFPQKGHLLEGARVRLILSSGPPRFEVPTVIGANLKNAGPLLATAGMHVGRVERRYSRTAAGAIIGQQPATGAMLWGSRIDLVISQGPRPTAVPDVGGLAVAKAIAQLKKAGFTVTKVRRFSNSVAKGSVVETAPSPGGMVPAGSAITVAVSEGPRYKQLTLPDVRTLGVAAARGKLEKLGLLVQVVQSCGSNGTIVQETDPIPGSVVRQHTRVALFVC